MHNVMMLLAAGSNFGLPSWLTIDNLRAAGLVVLGLSIIIFVHELGHYLAAKWMGIRVDRFAVGFMHRLVGWRRGEGLTFGSRPIYKEEFLREKGWGETDYCLKLLPIGGYVQMMGQDDFLIDEDKGTIEVTKDPRAFINRPVSARMVTVSAGVIFNIIFALMMFTSTYLVWGKDVWAPIVSAVISGSPAEVAGFLEGDRILSINGSPIDDMEDVLIASVLTDGPYEFGVQRDGKPLAETLKIPKLTVGGDALRIGLYPEYSTQFASDAPSLKAGDKILSIEDRPIRNGRELDDVFRRSEGRDQRAQIERRDPSTGATTSMSVVLTPRIQMVGKNPGGDGGPGGDVESLLGLIPLRGIGLVEPAGPASKAGLRVGDVVLEWGSVLYPTERELLDTIRNGGSKTMEAVVRRGGERVAIKLTPRVSIDPFGVNYPRIGVIFSEFDNEEPVIADIAADAPAAKMQLPRGFVILAINDQPTLSWSALYDLLSRYAGTDVRVRYRSGVNEGESGFSVPSSFVNELGLPHVLEVLAINGQERYELQVPAARASTQTTSTTGTSGTMNVSASVRSPIGIRQILEHFAGQTVNIRYRLSDADAPREAAFTVKADGSNADPWQLRFEYNRPLGALKKQVETVSANGSPLTAGRMAFDFVYKKVATVYLTLRRMATRPSTVQNVSGPIGIAMVATEQAKLGWRDLLDFLAWMSIQLAVLNFLPLPILDGGTMVMLIIEKFRGKRLSIDTQIRITLVGLAIIGLCSLFALFQDIRRVFGL